MIEIDHHPETRARIAGFQIPLLDESEHLALAAHRYFTDKFTVIGWDIGLGADGPALIEGNWNHGMDILQFANKIPFESTRLSELYAYHLNRLPESVWRAAAPIQLEPR